VSSAPRILLFGATGQLGRELQRSFADAGEIVACDRSSVDLSSADQVRSTIERVGPNVILNAAAYTAVDKAESERQQAKAINADAPRVMAEQALRRNALLVHYSTDYVFDGSKNSPWIETDDTNPLNTYGASKLAGEEAVRQVGGRYLIFRTSWVYGPHGQNFLFTMLRLARQRDELRIVDDQHGAPTTSIALADATRSAVDAVLAGKPGAAEDWAGVYHITCSGSVSWCGFARAIFERGRDLLEGKVPRVVGIPSSEYPTPARRPHNSVLSCEKLRTRFGMALPAWQDALDAVMQQIAARQASTEQAAG
jgi:dTDP-4-dehydrorhamnose reductase